MPKATPTAAANSATHALFLRGINVGGKHTLPMRELVALCEELGCGAVRSYIQSGNLVVRAAQALARVLPARLEAALAANYGFAVPVVMRSTAELRQVVRENPFTAEAGARPHLHLALLAAQPSAVRARELLPQRSPPDRFVWRGKHIYLCCPSGMARSKLTTAYFDATLQTTSTLRNWRTVEHMLAMLSGDS